MGKTVRARSKWYYPSHGDDLELEGDKVIKTPPEENRRRRTIILYKLNNSWGFTIQSYGIHHRRRDVVEHLTYVDHVEQGGAAQQAGMRPGDVILSINGRSMEDVQHKELVGYIKQIGDTMRVVVLFEDCCKKVELHMKYLKLQRTLAEKMFELRSLELQEKRVMRGLPQFDRSRSDRSTSTCSLSSSSFTERLSLVPELDRCPSPVLCSRSRKDRAETEDASEALDRMTQSVTVLSDGETNRKIRSSNHLKTGSMVDLTELGRVRKKKRKKIAKIELDSRHFQLSPHGGAKSKGPVERLPNGLDGVAVSCGNGEVQVFPGRGSYTLLESEINKLKLVNKTSDLSKSLSNLEATQTKREMDPSGARNLSSKHGIDRNKSSQSLSESNSHGAVSHAARSSHKVLNKSSPCLWSTPKNSARANNHRSRGILLDTDGAELSPIHKKSGTQDQLNGTGDSGIKSGMDDSPNSTQLELQKELSFSVESRSSDEFYQTFIEGDMDSPVSPKLNWSTHPILLKSESEPVTLRISKDSLFDSLDDVILPSPMKNEGDFTFNDVCSKPKRVPFLNQSLSTSGLSKSLIANRGNELHSTGSDNYRSRSMSESKNRDSEVSLRSMSSTASRFSYDNLPGMNISFTSEDYEITEL